MGLISFLFLFFSFDVCRKWPSIDILIHMQFLICFTVIDRHGRLAAHRKFSIAFLMQIRICWQPEKFELSTIVIYVMHHYLHAFRPTRNQTKEYDYEGTSQCTIETKPPLLSLIVISSGFFIRLFVGHHNRRHNQGIQFYCGIRNCERCRCRLHNNNNNNNM